MLAAVTVFAALLTAQDPLPPPPPTAPSKKLQQSPTPPPGEVNLGKIMLGSIATVDMPKGWNFRFENNGLRRGGAAVLGAAGEPGGRRSVMFAYRDCGHVQDDDADKIDFNEVCRQMMAVPRGRLPGSSLVKAQEIKMLGWAVPPSYDVQTKRLVHAEQLQIVGSPGEKVHCFGRLLGRAGVLEIDVGDDADQRDVLVAMCRQFLAASQLLPGRTYAEFDAAKDVRFEGGLGDLIAGSPLRKPAPSSPLFNPWLIGAAVAVVFLPLLLVKKPKAVTAEIRTH
jgi:hypothetical protein